MSKQLVKCEDCRHNVRHYCDGYVYKDWSGCYNGNFEDLPKIPDQSVFWTYQECKKNNKGMKFLNLTGECQGFEKAK